MMLVFLTPSPTWTEYRQWKPMAEKYICLAKYNCPCRPPGRQVGKTTGRRHLALAKSNEGSFLLLVYFSLVRNILKKLLVNRKKHDSLFIDYEMQRDSPFGVSGKVGVCDCADGRRLFLRVGGDSPPYAHVSPNSAAAAIGQNHRIQIGFFVRHLCAREGMIFACKKTLDAFMDWMVRCVFVGESEFGIVGIRDGSFIHYRTQRQNDNLSASLIFQSFHKASL